jgi:signal transduction histidine kinase
MKKLSVAAFKELPETAADAIMAVALMIPAMLSVTLRPPFVIRSGGFGGGPRPDAHFVESTGRPSGALYQHRPATLSYFLVAAAFLPLALRRRYPISVLVVTALVAATNDLIPGPPSLVFIAPLIALYTVGTLRSRRTLIIAAGLSAALQLAVAIPGYVAISFWADAVRIVSMIAVAAALGDATRNRRAYIAEVEQRAVDAERTREDEARRRVDEERLHIARELHDVTAHSLSIIAVQSGAAAHVIDSNPAEARRALEAIRRTSKDALDDLRAMLGVLRSNDESDAPLAPAPGLERLGELAGPMHDAGVDVTFELGDGLDDLPAVVGSSAYRIVQEALTNVVRHAGPCSATVRVWREDGELSIDVLDNGRGPTQANPSAGHGLAGMRERAVALGGSLAAGAAEGGGFVVRANLPVGGKGGQS